MPRSLFLDSGPLGLVTKRKGKSPEVDQCQAWLRTLLVGGWDVYLPEITDYEIRRELTRIKNTAGIARLDALHETLDYLPLTTAIMRHAAELWGQSRNAGLATAPPEALDGDVLLVAQVLSLGLPESDIMVATVNVRHISRFVPADTWENIMP